MKLKIYLTIISCILVISAFTQSNNVESKNHDEYDHEHKNHHEHHRNEIGVANAPVYFINEKQFAYGLHVHYIRSIPNSKFGIGLGYERIFDAHKHNTIGIVGVIRPIDKFSIIISPGLTFEDGNKSGIFACHFETSYEFEFKNFHVGPAFEVAYDPEDYHISLGLHLGYGF